MTRIFTTVVKRTVVQQTADLPADYIATGSNVDGGNATTNHSKNLRIDFGSAT